MDDISPGRLPGGGGCWRVFDRSKDEIRMETVKLSFTEILL